MKKIILFKSSDELFLYDGTIKNVMDIFENAILSLPSEVKDLTRESKTLVVKEWILGVLNEIMDNPAGSNCFGLSKVLNKDVKITPEMKVELASFVFNNNIVYKDDRFDNVIFKYEIDKKLSFFKFLSKENTLYISKSNFDMYKKFNMIRNDLFPHEMSEDNKINFILNFINEDCGMSFHGKFSLQSVENDFANTKIKNNTFKNN